MLGTDMGFSVRIPLRSPVAVGALMKDPSPLKLPEILAATPASWTPPHGASKNHGPDIDTE